MRRFTLFATPIGCCGLAWNDVGLIGVQLPEADEAKTRARLVRRFPDAVETAPPPAVQSIREGVVALIAGEKRDLSFAALDLSEVPAFNRKVYAIALAIKPGETRTYGDIATALGDRNAARAVGRALGENPFPIVVPCHRVLAAGGGIGGFSANGGAVTKAKLLTIEGARTNTEPTLFDDVSTFSVAPARGRP